MARRREEATDATTPGPPTAVGPCTASTRLARRKCCTPLQAAPTERDRGEAWSVSVRISTVRHREAVDARLCTPSAELCTASLYAQRLLVPSKWSTLSQTALKAISQARDWLRTADRSLEQRITEAAK